MSKYDCELPKWAWVVVVVIFVACLAGLVWWSWLCNIPLSKLVMGG